MLIKKFYFECCAKSTCQGLSLIFSLGHDYDECHKTITWQMLRFLAQLFKIICAVVIEKASK